MQRQIVEIDLRPMGISYASIFLKIKLFSLMINVFQFLGSQQRMKISGQRPFFPTVLIFSSYVQTKTCQICLQIQIPFIFWFTFWAPIFPDLIPRSAMNFQQQNH